MGCVLSTDRERPLADAPAAQPASPAVTTADASPAAHETKVADAAAGLLGLRGLRRWRHAAFSADLQRLRTLARGDCSESLTFSPRALKFFVSSTFTDTAAERDALWREAELAGNVMLAREAQVRRAGFSRRASRTARSRGAGRSQR